MPVDLVAGTMGGGKSYYVVEQCVKAWREGAHVVSNLDFYPEKIAQHGWTERWTDMRGRPIHEWMDHIVKGIEGCENVVAVDEAGMELNAMDQADTKKHNRILFQFLSYSRKMGLEVYFICQHHGNLDVGLRKMMRQTVWCINVEKQIPIWGPMLSIFWDFKRQILSQKNTILSATYSKRSTVCDEIYDTFGAAGHTADIKRHTTRKKKLKWGRWVCLGACVSLVLGAVFGFTHLISGGLWVIENMGGKGHKKTELARQEQKNGETIATAIIPAPTEEKPLFINGTYQSGVTTRLYLEGRETIQVGEKWRDEMVLAMTGDRDGGYYIFRASGTKHARFKTRQEIKEMRSVWMEQQQYKSSEYGRADSSLLGSLARGFGQLTAPVIPSAQGRTEISP